MKRLVLLLIPGLLLLAACAPSRYVWQHESGLGETELQQAHEVCDQYAAEQIPPRSYWGFPYPYGGYPFYYGDYGHNYRHHHHYRGPYSYRGYYPHDYYSGIDTYAYQKDLSRACLKGKGWDLIKVDDG